MSEQNQTLNPGLVPSVRVLLADDSALVRRAIRQLLADEPVHLVGEAESFTQAMEMCSELNPKIVLVDLRMRDEGKFSADFIKRHFLGCAEHVLAMSLWNDDEAKEVATSYGADTLLAKNQLADLVIPAILKLT